MHKSYLLLPLFFSAQQSCSRGYERYEGYVFEADTRKPVAGLGVRLQFSSRVDTLTDERGYFSVAAKPNVLENIYLLKNGVLVDSIYPVHKQAGESFEKRFVNGRSDTLFVRTR